MFTSTLELIKPVFSGESDRQTAALRKTIEQAANLLPIPGPISAFAFLNTLQALEDLPFDVGMQRGARLYGAQPYLTEEHYREHLAKGRIRVEDLGIMLRRELKEQADEIVFGSTTRLRLRLAMLQFPLKSGPDAELRWYVAETDALQRVRSEVPAEVRKRFLDETRHWVMRDLLAGDGSISAGKRLGRAVIQDVVDRFGQTTIETWSDATWESLAMRVLWRICRQGVHGLPDYQKTLPGWQRHRDVLLAATQEDSDFLVHSLLVRFCAAFTDQGFANWTLPSKEQGFYRSFLDMFRQAGGPPDCWLHGLPAEANRLHSSAVTPLESIQESLDLLGVSEVERDDFLTQTLLALRGWAGMIWQMETRGDRVPHPVTPGTLVEFLAIRLMLDRLALAYLSRAHLGYVGSLDGMRIATHKRVKKSFGPTVEQRAFQVFQVAQFAGWTPADLLRLTHAEWQTLVDEIEGFSQIDRRRVFHLGFERKARVRLLDAVAFQAERPPERVRNPSFQIAFCIDAREESFRRHLEEVDPQVETYGAPGFYGVAMYYRGIADAHYAALCPIVVFPKHWVVEDVIYPLEQDHLQSARVRKALGTATHRVHMGSRNFASGALLAAGVGVLASIPLVARVLFPRLTARLRRMFGRMMEPPPITRLRLERSAPNPGKDEESIGYSVEEMAIIGERMLRDIGLTSSFSRLVIFLGHGSFCLNNPHRSAYDCGACAGAPGGPNGRALAMILNDRRVRQILADRGLTIPQDTVFIGGLHNTAVDTVAFADLDLLPPSHRKDIEHVRRVLGEVCLRNAHERCRRFESAPLNMTLEEAHEHVEERSEDLAQTRPEFGNASNFACIVARRERTRGLYLDRRVFLTSYDPTQDDAESMILARILSAAVPVCEGINMQYYLSYVDSRGWACGTKLPHNVASLLGVMDGAASDLRPGLPWQSVEIHEPVRCHFIIESTPEAMTKIMDRNQTIGKIFRNEWAHLAVLSPDAADIHLFWGGEFHLYQPEATELPHAPSSIDWYRGWRDHLEFAVIDKLHS